MEQKLHLADIGNLPCLLSTPADSIPESASVALDLLSWVRPTGWSVRARIWNVTRSPSVTSFMRNVCTSAGMMDPYSFPSFNNW